MVIESDAQSYMLNWTSRVDRRNVEIFAYCSVDSASRYVLGMHPNYDPNVDEFTINREAARIGDMSAKEPYRKYARYWLAGDDMRAGRSRNFKTRGVRQALAGQIEELYAEAASREDVEDIELEHMDITYKTPYLKDGLLIHMPYTSYAHWFLLRRLLVGAGVERTQFHFDIDSMSRAAFLCSYIQEIKERRAHAFYVKYDKDFTVDQRRAAVAKARARRGRVRAELPPDEHRHVDLIMMKRSLADGHCHGKWNDEWFDHPNPSMNEPHKAMSWLTPDPALDEDTVARMFLRGAARPRRQCVHADPAPVQCVRASDRDSERTERGLARLPAVQPDDGAEVPHDLPGGQQLHPSRKRRQDAGDAAGPGEEALAVRGHFMARGKAAAKAGQARPGGGGD